MKNQHLYAIVSTMVLFIIASYIFSLFQELDYTVATCMPHKCFCEAIHHQSYIKQFSNTVSSFSFVYLGILIIFQNQQNKLFQIFGLFTAFIGLGSAFFHATLSFLGQSFDLAGIYLLTSFIFVYALYRIYNLGTIESMILLIIINFVLDIGLIYTPELRRYLVGLLVVFGLLSEVFYIKSRLVNIQTKWITYSSISIVLAFCVWVVDIQKILCYPQSIFQGHALWHFLSTLSIYFLYKYYRSEKF